MSNRELLDKIQELGIYQGKLNAYLKKHFPDLFNELVSRTHFLDDFYKDKSVPMPARLYCLEHDLKEQPRCQNPNCPNHNPHVKWKHNGTYSFDMYCCRNCRVSSPITNERCRQTNLKRHGVEFTFQSEEFKRKSRETNLRKRGVEYASQSQEFKEHVKNTCRRKYNVDFSSQAKEVKDKIAKTCMERFGVKCVLSSNDIREKIKRTNLQRRGVENPIQDKSVQEKIRQTNIKRRGVPCSFQDENVKQKIKETMLAKHGVIHYSKTDEFKQKCKDTCNKNTIATHIQILMNSSVE